jgi:uronate dehydrogenase
MTRMLVTGLSGLIGGAARPVLEGRYELSALNRREVEGVATFCADLEQGDAIDEAFADQDIVVHLAAKITDEAGWDSLHAMNVVGTRSVFEAARVAGVKKVIFASSGATVSGWENHEPYKAIVEGRYDDVPDSWDLIDESMAVRPANLYASTKVWGEALACHYAQAYGIEMTCLRIGYVNAEDKPSGPRQHSVWLSQRDVVSAITLAAESNPPQGCASYLLTSRNRWSYRNLAAAQRDFGYEPLDEAEAHGP